MDVMIELDSRLICDLELLLIRGFAPLDGFMNKDDYMNVVNNMRLKNGTPFPIPIVLPISEETKNKIKDNTKVVLIDNTNLPLASLQIGDIWKPNLMDECRKVLGSDDSNHPWVQRNLELIKKFGSVWYIGGKVEKINGVQHYNFKNDRLIPEQTKEYFAANNWSTIVGFQTRNPMHRSHFELTKYALNQTKDESAKLLLSPIVGVTQTCDIDYVTRVKCYKILVDKYYPKDTVLLTLIPLAMRMAGPREAMWHSIIRKNYGCTHFVVGRDHAGPSSKKQDGSNFYGPYDAHKLLEQFSQELGINIIKSQMISYVPSLDTYLPQNEIKNGMKVLNISGTEQRRLLRNNEEIPSWFSFPEVIDQLRLSVIPKNKQGFCIYLIGLCCSGKSTISRILQHTITEYTNRPITILDGDIVRKNLSKGLTFTKEDRSINVRRIGFVASEIVKHNGICICANIAPYEYDRQLNREAISNVGNYIEVYVNTPIEECEKRDIKGLYALARNGTIKQFTGISDPFEEPCNSDLEIDGRGDIEKSVELIINELKNRGLL